MSFEQTTIGEYATVQGGYAFKSHDFQLTGFRPVLKIKNVRNGHVDYSDTTFVSEEVALACDKWVTSIGDILISMTGSGPNAPESLVGRVARVWESDPLALINQRVGKLNLRGEGVIDKDFLFYVLSQRESQEFLVSNSTGSANQVNINSKTIESLPCPIVSYSESREIASFLNNLNRRIHLLRETNATLEAIAQALFKSWFVDFDPVHANAASGDQEQAPSLPAEIQALFPSRFVESPQGLIPEGWEVKKCSEVIDVRDGTHASPKASETGYPLLTSKHITSGELLFDGAYLISEADYLDISKRSKVDHLDVLITMIGTVGVTAFVLNESTYFAIKNIGLFKTSKRPELASYIYLLLSSREMKHYLEARIAGTTQKYLSLKALREIAIIEPEKPVIQAFSELVKPIFEKIHQNRTSVQTLSTLRDTLLPRLISGQLRLPEVV